MVLFTLNIFELTSKVGAASSIKDGDASSVIFRAMEDPTINAPSGDVAVDIGNIKFDYWTPNCDSIGGNP